MISRALSKVFGLEGKVAIDATNILPDRHGDFPSSAAEVESFTHAPVAKAFNLNFGNLLRRGARAAGAAEQMVRRDEGAREATEQLICDAGYDPVRVGDLSRARDLENAVWLLVGI